MQQLASAPGHAALTTPPTRGPWLQRRGSGRQGAARAACSDERHGPGGRLEAAAAPPPPPPLRPQAVDRRGMLALPALLAAANLALPTPQAAAATAARPVEPLPVPPLTETFTSTEVSTAGTHGLHNRALCL